MKKVFKIILIVILAIVIVGFLGFTFFVGKGVFDSFSNAQSRKKTNEDIAMYIDEYEDFESRHDIESFSIKSSKYDHEIPAIYVKDEGNKNIAVLVHGFGGTKKSVTAVADAFLDLGYNCIIYDQRNSGDNMAEYNTFGVLESYDCEDMLKFALEDKKEDSKLLLFGESAGAATALITSSRFQEMDYLVLDSPLTDGYVFAEKEFDKIEKDTGLPKSFMKFAGNIFYQVKLGFTLDDMNSVDYIKDKNFSIPTLIIHSKADEVTPYEMAKSIYDSLNTKEKVLHEEEEYGHTKFAAENPEKFKEVLKNFLEIY
ncbi:MAG: alpha/beta fold hydrolase [Lagierella massiliensis]|nr:alpha/beta fold hydrolase [Lagierella massiliensis]